MRKTLTMLVLLASLLAAGCGGSPDADSNPGAPSTTTGSGGAAETTRGEMGGGETTRATADGELPVVTISASGAEEVEVRVEVADSGVARYIGLRWRESLPEDRGMLFVYGKEREMSFTMADTVIPLSIAFIDSEGRIVDIQDMEPLEEGPYRSAEPARYALEVNQGFFAQRGVEVRDTVEIPEGYR